MFLKKLRFIFMIVLITANLLVIAAPSALSSSYYIYDDFGGSWQDAEKTPYWPPFSPDDDDYMCWAAAASNILDWGGWGTAAYNDEDKIFQNFQYHWTNQGSLMDVGWKWWIDGTYPEGYPGKYPYEGSNWSEIDVPGGGGYWPEHEFSDYYHENWNPAQSMTAIDDYLHEGYGTAIAVYAKIMGKTYGHALTVWGYEYSGTNDYLGIHVTDSDDYLSQLDYYTISWNNGKNRWNILDFADSASGWYIGGVEGLAATPEPVSSVLYIIGGASLVFFRYYRTKKNRKV